MCSCWLKVSILAIVTTSSQTLSSFAARIAIQNLMSKGRSIIILPCRVNSPLESKAYKLNKV